MKWERLKTKVTRRQVLICVALFVLIATVACKKEIKVEVEPPDPVVSERTEAQKLRDSVYYYYKLYSLWTEDLPERDPISNYTDQFSSYTSVLNNLKGRTPFFAPYGGAIDRFSYIEDISSGSSGSARADIADGYGIYVSIVNKDGQIRCFVNFVEGNSPAFLEGIRRGNEVIAVNDQTLAGMGAEPMRTFLGNALSRKSNLKIEILQDGEPDTETINLAYTSYSIDPITKDTIFEEGSKKIGYLALSSFEELYNHGTSVSSDFRNELIRVFNDFDQAEISDLILDLRYNIGGYVSTAIFIANKVINSAESGNLMFKYGVNANLEGQRGRYGFSDVYFSRLSESNVQNIYFLVTENTASAAEILISVMLPYYGYNYSNPAISEHVHIIAEKTHTYGKPVGFFRQDIMGKVGLWATSFKVVNADDYTDYYEGIAATKPDVKEDVTVDFGDPAESMIAQAISHATTGNFLSLGGGSGSSGGPSLRNGRQSIVKPIKVMDVNKRPPRHLLK